MEDSLGLFIKFNDLENAQTVLILVVMEDSLGLQSSCHWQKPQCCLNPCCNGR